MVQSTFIIWNHFKKDVCGKTTAISKYWGLKYLYVNATKMSKYYEKRIKRPIEFIPSFSSLQENLNEEQVAAYNLSQSVSSSHSDFKNSYQDLIIIHKDSSTSSSISEDSAWKKLKLHHNWVCGEFQIYCRHLNQRNFIQVLLHQDICRIAHCQ